VVENVIMESMIESTFDKKPKSLKFRNKMGVIENSECI
jgi:hypothetical protein